ncbi:d-lactaldehyde dehydrogenase [Ceraceosorus bombacis]|uniref:D-lactaldehyde dehydrogenase n=1 Tax=Ceraceosorus bombacis TaxID=401625 RepID=A0A0P1BID3_9BASI|nr:d-lactaldehyde dehydrogenase [Ceraceosorus bombacis]
MPAIQSGKVLVTGASGYAGAWLCLALLRQGFSVRGTVRSTEKGHYLQQLFHSQQQQFAKDKFEFVIAEDLEKEGAFDQAVVGVDAVFHSGSPFHYDAKGQALTKLVHPAVNGTKNVLNSIHAHGTSVKRVIIFSSFAAIVEVSKPVPTVFNEESWNETHAKESAEKGEDQDPLAAYRASKTLAERAAWGFVEEKKVPWDLVTVNPPFIFGPPIHDVSGGAEKLNTSLSIFWGLLHGSKSESDLLAPGGSLVDVRDVAETHVQALKHGQAGGQRYAPTSGPFTFQDIADAVHGAAQGLVPEEWKKATPKGKAGKGKEVVQNSLDGSKTAEQLGIKYKSIPTIVLDTVAALKDYEERKWKPFPSDKVLAL